MRKKETISYFVIVVTLFCLLNIPTPLVRKMRQKLLFTSKLFASTRPVEEMIEIARLKLENQMLKEQVELARHFLSSQDRIEEQVKKIDELLEEGPFDPYNKRRVAALKTMLSLEVESVEALVIFRDPALWGSGFWVNKGARENTRHGRTIIAKNSPVVVGSQLIGVVEEVEENRSYVRLITDASLTPAVRALRGSDQNEAYLRELDRIEEMVLARSDLQKEAAFTTALRALKQEILEKGERSEFLVKGEIRGSSYPLWRSLSSTLKGVGFNYEYSDEEGPIREIHEKGKVPLLAVGDLLITSGLDGVFPKGLEVGIVSKIAPLQEGSFAYELEAKTLLTNLDEITWVQICPPLL